MIKLGITGGIGTGKSVVADLLLLMGIPVYNADTESKRLSACSEEIKAGLTARFGNALYSGNKLNKQALAALIFSSQEHLLYVNSVIHPVVLNDFRCWAAKQSSEIVAIESAILFESGFDAAVDMVVSVTAPLELRYRRVAKRDGLSREQIGQRIASQWPDEEKLKRSHFVVYNDEEQALIPQVEQLVRCLSEQKAADF